MRYIIVLLIIFVGAFAHAQQMEVVKKSGTSTAYDISDIIKIEFNSTSQNIDLTSGSATDNLGDIRKIVFNFGTSSNANLASITTSEGTLVPEFSANTTSYSVELPAGTTTVPTVSATAAESNATVNIAQATSLTGSEAQRTATVTVTAEDGTTTKTYTVVFSVESAIPDFSLTASTTSLSIPQGAFGTTDISFTPSGGFSGTVALSIDAATPLPAGVTAQFTPASISSGSSILRFDVAATAAPAGPITLIVKGESGGSSKTIDINLTITEVTEPDFVLNATPQSVTISQGGGADINVTITALGGFNQEVDLTANIVQDGLYASFNPNFLSGGGQSLLTITADVDADLGAGELTITATSGTIVHTVSIALQVEPPPVVVVPANQFSPNGDGIDDTWQITDIEQAPQLAILVFDRTGQVVFQTTSYQNDWDGTSNGKQLLPATYYFVIRNERGENVESGSVNLIR